MLGTEDGGVEEEMESFGREIGGVWPINSSLPTLREWYTLTTSEPSCGALLPPCSL